MKKTIYHFLLITVLCSCAVEKLRIPTTAINLNTKEKIAPKNIKLEKGKICFIYTTKYSQSAPGQHLLSSKTGSNFVFGRFSSSSFLGGGNSQSTVDTVINNTRLVQTALQAVWESNITGFQYQFVRQGEFTDTNGKLNISMIQAKFNPDIIINLKDFTLKVAGKANIGTNVIASKPMMALPGVYSSISPKSNYYGNILMDYTTCWEVINIEENQRKRIQLTGRYVSLYYANYSMYEELMTSARKVGKEFAALIKGH